MGVSSPCSQTSHITEIIVTSFFYLNPPPPSPSYLLIILCFCCCCFLWALGYSLPRWRFRLMPGGSSFSPLVQSQNLPSGHNHFFLPWSDAFPGEHAMLSFEESRGGCAKSGQSFFRSFEMTEYDLDNYYLQQPEKKRRLTADQVQFLEKSFENENKLEPEKKVQHAKELGL